jgi:CBS domain-containing protein
MTTVHDILQKQFVAVEADDTVSALIGRLVHERSTQALVFSNEQFVGMVSAAAVISR